MSRHDNQVARHENIACVTVAARQSSPRRDRQIGLPVRRNASIQIVALHLSIPQFGDPLFTPEWLDRNHHEIWCRQQADEYVSARGLRVDDEDRLRIAKAVGSGAQQATLALKRQAKGDFSADLAAPLTSAPLRAAQATSQSEKIAFQTLLDGWAAEKQPSQKTLYSWKRVLDQVDAFVGHGDASQLTPDDILRWKASLIDAGLRTKTIREFQNCPAARNPAVGRR